MTVRVPFSLVDVFAEQPLKGNPLAVVPDADPVTDVQMRAIAAEFNLSETTFLVSPTMAGASWRLRSFTAAGVEVGGAGHQALGAWSWLSAADRLPPGAQDFVQQIGERLLPLRVTRFAGVPAQVSMWQAAPTFGAVLDDFEALCHALSLGTEDGLRDIPPQVVSTGVGHLLVGLRDRSAVDRARPESARLLELLRASGAEGAYVYSLDPVDPASGAVAYARFFNPTVGIAEDPATGTAVGPLISLLVARGILPDGVSAVVEQGFAMGRPSWMRVGVAGNRVTLTGSSLVVADGVLYL